MNWNKDTKIGMTLLVTGIIGLLLTQGSCMHSNMMNDQRHMSDMMGNSGSMKEMMQQNMGDQLSPPDIKSEHLPEPESEGVKLLSTYCTQCHDLPAPGLHTADEWPAVVQRMNSRMQIMADRGMMHNARAPSKAEIESILAYLQKHGL